LFPDEDKVPAGTNTGMARYAAAKVGIGRDMCALDVDAALGIALYADGGRWRMDPRQATTSRLLTSDLFNFFYIYLFNFLVGHMHRPTPTAHDVPRAAVGVAFPTPTIFLAGWPETLVEKGAFVQIFSTGFLVPLPRPLVSVLKVFLLPTHLHPPGSPFFCFVKYK
jgi:hypothetical protein